ncbi:TPA: hypothetical protein RZC51_000759 [Burkholderia cenocepacia]|nr:hypothetical protein [Burkholderia cenocepacia]
MTYAHFSNNTDGLTAHSVVRGADDVLFDITPLEREEERKGMRFVPHLGSEDEFTAERQRNIFINCPCAGEFCP